MLEALSGVEESYAELLDDDGGAGADEGIDGSSERSARFWEHSLEWKSPMQNSLLMTDVLVLMRELMDPLREGLGVW